MFNTARRVVADRSEDERGFTLIELMVVVMIIAVLLAIAVPTFLGAQNKARDRSAQSGLRNTLTAAKSVYADTQSYSGATVAGLGAAEPSLSFQTTASTKAKEVSVLTTATATTFYAVALSASGTCYTIRDISTSGTTFSKMGTGACTGDNAAIASAVGVATWAAAW